MVTAEEIDAQLCDTFAFGRIPASHGGYMYPQALARVKKLLGVAPRESLALVAGAKYGTDAVFAVLDIAVSIANVQLSKTSSHITAAMGYSGMDAYADAKDACHFMTSSFAELIIKNRPAPEKIIWMIQKGQLTQLGISPTDIDLDELRNELSKLGPGYSKDSRTPTKLPELSALDDECTAENGHPCYEIALLPQAITVGDAMESHLSLRKSVLREKEAVRLMKVFLPLIAVAVSLWRGGQLLFEPAAWRPVPVLLSVVVVLLPAVGGYWIARISGLLLELERSSFFMKARDLNHYTVLEGRRDAAFLDALRQLRPVSDIVADARGHGIYFSIQQDERKVPLAFQVRQAKVAWTTRSHLENQPLQAICDSYNGMRMLFRVHAHGRSTADLEAEAAVYESRTLPPLFFASTETINKGRAAANKGLMIAAALCIGVPIAGRFLAP